MNPASKMSVLRTLIIGTPAVAMQQADALLDVFHREACNEVHRELLKMSYCMRDSTSYTHKVYAVFGWIFSSSYAKLYVAQTEQRALFSKFFNILTRGFVFFSAGLKANGTEYDDTLKQVVRQLGVFVHTMRSVYVLL
jgi:hypothetical protein